MHILLDPKFDNQYLCDHPILVQNNVAFVIDISKLQCRDDIRADDMGSWRCTGSRILTCYVSFDGDVCSIVGKQTETSHVVKIRRQYHVHGTDRDLHRMIAFVVSPKESDIIPSIRCISQYWFESGNEHLVSVKPHGNSKEKTESYCRTHPSTLAALKCETEEKCPKEAVNTVYQSHGGIMESNSLGKLPRNREQFSNLRRLNKNVSMCSNKGLNDPLFLVMEQSKLCGDNFVRIVTASPEPMCILSTDQQLRDLQRFSTNAGHFSVVCNDPTFSLGDFSVTCITYRHLLIKDRRTGESPIMLGPILVHQRKLFETYFFASSLISLAPSLDHLLAFGTDGEEALQSAFNKQFKFAIQLRCFRHVRQNIRRKLTSDMGVEESKAAEILSHIFGKKSGANFYEGLVDAESESAFEQKLSFSLIWNDICGNARDGLSFPSWFVKYHAKSFVQCMLKPVRVAAGLGDPQSFVLMTVKLLTLPLSSFLVSRRMNGQFSMRKLRSLFWNKRKKLINVF